MRVDQLAHNPVDAWLLKSYDKYRVLIPKDENCLYRAIAEQMCLTQDHYNKVKEKLLDYCVDHGIENLQAFEELELDAKLDIVSAAYKRNVVLFSEVEGEPKTFGKYGDTKQTIYLRLDTEDHTFESIRDIEHMEAMAVCQSLLYETLYEGVFGMKEEEVEDTVQKVRQKAYNNPNKLNRHRQAVRTSSGTKDEKRFEQLPPFPFRVAKSLDPAFFRNVPFDVWQDSVKEKGQFKLGDKVVVCFEGESVVGHVQGIQDKELSVFIQPQGKGQSITVSIEKVAKQPTSKRCPNKSRATPSISCASAEGNERRTSTVAVNPMQQPPVFAPRSFIQYYPPGVQPQNIYPVYYQHQPRHPTLQPVPQYIQRTPPPYLTQPWQQIVPPYHSLPPTYQPPPMPPEQSYFQSYYTLQYPDTGTNAGLLTYNSAEGDMASVEGQVIQLANQVTS